MMELFRLERHRLLKSMLIISVLYQNLHFCFSLNDEGFSLLRFRDRVVNDPFGVLSNWNDDIGGANPCSWFGVNCSNGRVVALNLRNMCLGGTLAPDLGNLAHLKSIILRNNSFHGTIPKKIGQMKKLKVLDLGYNNFGGPLPSDLRNSQLPKILSLDNNELLDSISPEVQQLTLLPEAEQRSYRNRREMTGNIAQTGVESHRKLLVTVDDNISVPPVTVLLPPPLPSPPPISPSPSPSKFSPTGAPVASPSPSPVPSAVANLPPPTPPTILDTSAPLPTPSAERGSNSKNHTVVIATVVVGGSALVGIAALLLWRCNKVATVRPWATGLSGQLQKAFVTGVPKLKRSELEAACEDFSNVIGSTSFGTIYKGTLSSGVEIAVASVAAPSAKDWSKHLESLFRKRIDMLSKVNHKNFVNLLGYCEEDMPFTRMIAFEYAPNGTLFEHLHIQEAEHLDWAMRMRIAMGMAYCLDYMHQLTPPISHKNLNSSSVNLTEDYAAKISDFGLCNDSSAANTEPTPESNVYSFGIILFEMITGRIPYAGGDAIDDWVLDFLRGENPMIELVDPTLDSFDADQLEATSKVIRSCVNPDPRRRPKMREVTSKLKEMTRISQDGATPKISPLWWAELEILSTEAT
ncbi:inactive receptor-like serine/threonine-protein kinase At2g40270 [Cynara cardunculus var. scolymus]|uniref:inactive receptor-like serine/threonine-protein kinase At2g40270 n=1 Tax=Cynara cardunculus var. scolymus TaxID=59895 RepID=UPI000D62B6B3|nr:inactive receptor-like serine/threonine-protein kinase At2g40270 [Cynara cardunculus var. scolymus]